MRRNKSRHHRELELMWIILAVLSMVPLLIFASEKNSLTGAVVSDIQAVEEQSSVLAAASAHYEVEVDGSNSGGLVAGDASTSGGQYIQFTDGGDYWEIATNMTSMAVWATQSVYGTLFDVYINGTFYGRFNTYDQAGTTYKKEFRLFNFLNGANHTIRINHTGEFNPSGQKVLDLDSFIVNASSVVDTREAEDEWINRSGTYTVDTGNASGNALLQLTNRESYWQGYGSGKYLLIYTKNSLYSSWFNVSYNGIKGSFNTYYNGYLHQQKNVFNISTTDQNYLLSINNSGINNSQNNSLVELDYIIFYPFERPTNSTVNTITQINRTIFNITWNNSTADSNRTITYFVVATAFENSTSVRVANTTDDNLSVDMSTRPHDYYRFRIEANDDYLEAYSAQTDELLYFDHKSASQRAVDAANYIYNAQDGNGATRDYWDDVFHNSDNTAGYGGIALYAAWKNTSNTTFIDALGKHLDWLSNLTEENGTLHYSYKYNTTTGTYYPDVWDYYKALNITDIKVVDAIQSFYAYDLWLYQASGRNSSKVSNLTNTADRAMRRLIVDNYDGSLFFYSSSNFKNTTNNWALLQTKYAAGQVDLFLGMLALWNLTQNLSYLQYAHN
ncbi:MAG: hypothetical protein AABX05_00885, partial [Nanoarchaeota archaeon]